ncbi:CPBP family intramembrane metalloprotease [Pseudoflavonifractor sp. 524-17]|uniref:CPBP family intramembrane glutamic endopeptidase n=1 Tax=Pseudoflavonifractor sp. 524-17 TaxID=2304577 RepID=UPI00137B5993|nr:CPBP family intramembrane glutamic endopeptidase [Pseudoflavonifractor sp. 524-17]NCE63626.1 CPBP family intramembrane metalloprotease [Pseudoflavonifractor sp. 524-17]
MYPRRTRLGEPTPAQCARGLVLALFHLIFFPFAMVWVQRTAGGEIPAAEANAVCYLLSVVLAFALFWGVLREHFNRLLDRPAEHLVILLAALAAAGALHLVAVLPPYPVENPAPMAYAQEFALAPRATAVILVVLMPIVEELLFRWLIFGVLRRHSIWLAYLVSGGGFALYCVLRYAFSGGGTDLRYLLLGAQYLPMSLALCWAYGRTRCLWTAIVLHMALNGLILWGAVALYSGVF